MITKKHTSRKHQEIFSKMLLNYNALLSHSIYKCLIPYLQYVFEQTGLSKQCWPRRDAKEWTISSGSSLFVTHPAILDTTLDSKLHLFKFYYKYGKELRRQNTWGKYGKLNQFIWSHTLDMKDFKGVKSQIGRLCTLHTMNKWNINDFHIMSLAIN